MIRKYQIYLIKLFLKKIINIFFLFLSLIFILSIFEEISFFKDMEVNFYFPMQMAILNSPSIVFEIFPFIFLISSQFFFLELIKKNELEFLKISGLNNFKIIKTLFFASLVFGIILLSVYYSFSSKLKFLYLDLKNSYSNDNKYLMVIKESGLWIKDEIDGKVYIINANKIDDNYLKFVSINEFDSNFNLLRIIESDMVNISNTRWIISKPLIIKNNQILKNEKDIDIISHFNSEKINTMFENLTSLNLLQLAKLNKDYKTLGYSTSKVETHLHKLYSFPLFLSLMTIVSSIIMLNIKRNKPIAFHIIFGIFISVLIYYINHLFNLLGENNKIPIIISSYLPLIILGLIISIGLVRINEK